MDWKEVNLKRISNKNKNPHLLQNKKIGKLGLGMEVPGIATTNE